MQAGEGGSSWRARPRRLAPRGLGLLLVLLAGCAAPSRQLDNALMAEKSQPARRDDMEDQYLIGCPDVLELTAADHPEVGGRRPVAPDGRIDLGNLGRPRVEGRTAPEVARVIADRLGLPAAGVRVRVAQYNSQQVYLVGEVRGQQRAVPYRGPETVAELLQRVGGITPGAAPGAVYVVRSHVTDGRTPEVFRVDLQAIVLRRDQRTNLTLQPFDQVHVGETRQSRFARVMPPVMLPFYETLFGLEQPGKSAGPTPGR